MFGPAEAELSRARGASTCARSSPSRSLTSSPLRSAKECALSCRLSRSQHTILMKLLQSGGSSRAHASSRRRPSCAFSRSARSATTSPGVRRPVWLGLAVTNSAPRTASARRAGNSAAVVTLEAEAEWLDEEVDRLEEQDDVATARALLDESRNLVRQSSSPLPTRRPGLTSRLLARRSQN